MSLENETIPEEEVPEVPIKPPYPYPPRGKGKKLIKLTANLTEYHNNYYHQKRSAPVHCENCAKLVCRAKIYRHVQTLSCARNTKDQTEIESIKEAYRQSLLPPKIEEA